MCWRASSLACSHAVEACQHQSRGSDSGANLGLTNVGRKYLHNLRALPQGEWVTVTGINSTDAVLKEVADIYYRMSSVVCAHEDELPALFGHVRAGAKPLNCYMSSTVFVHKDLPEGFKVDHSQSWQGVS